jgi:hypothetical protein
MRMRKKKIPRFKDAIAKRGTRVAKPKRKPARKREFIGRLDGVFRIVGDIESPLVPPEDWEYD